jgi:hypothetical protein
MLCKKDRCESISSAQAFSVSHGDRLLAATRPAVRRRAHPAMKRTANAVAEPMRRRTRTRRRSARTISSSSLLSRPEARQLTESRLSRGRMSESVRIRPMARRRLRDTLQDDPEVLAWWALTPAQRFRESATLWSTFLALGGSLEPEPDSQSPFYFAEASGSGAAHGRSGVHPVRRRRVQPRRRPRRAR